MELCSNPGDPIEREIAMNGTKMHLVQMMFHTPIAHTVLGWAQPNDRQVEGLTSFAYWQDIARTAERGCLDGIFFADTPAARDEYQGKFDANLRYGVVWPTHDPMPVVAAMAAATEKLGFAVTLSVTGTPPYLAVRRLSTLDCLSNGRIGWNVVTGFLKSEHRAVGSTEIMEHDERYDYADEYMEICNAFWKSADEDAFPVNRETGIFADPSKIRVVDYEGRFLRSRGVNPVMRSAQGRPVIFQAGSSGRGMRFAARHAEVVFAIQPHLAGMKAFVDRIEAARKEVSRPDPVRVLFGVQPVIADSLEKARERVTELGQAAPLDAVLSRLSGTFGVDLSKFDPDKPVGELQSQASLGMIASLTDDLTGRPTLREVARRFAVSGGLLQLMGTPIQVADQMEKLWRESGGHGFIVTPMEQPGSIEQFVHSVVPILQERGIFRREYETATFRGHLH
jgi:FMN-dependent oxidoreductase (nitrilotriacetate monooxygenase family)